MKAADKRNSEQIYPAGREFVTLIKENIYTVMPS